MPVNQLFSYLVPPRPEGDEEPQVLGASVSGEKLTRMITQLFENAAHECDTEILFRPAGDKQQNDCRDELIRHARKPSLEAGRLIANRLCNATTHRSGLGLLFLALGTANNRPRLVVARFPADQGVIARELPHSLDVEFVERIFMKSAKAYKCVVYEGPLEEFWKGRAVDNQANVARELSDYWIRDFLQSELETTAASGTRRLASAIRESIKIADDSCRAELLSAAQLLRGKDGKRVTPGELATQLALSAETIELIRNALPRPELMDTKFQFSREVFEKHVAYKAVRLDNGGTLIGESDRFEEIFNREDLADNAGVRYITQGRIVNEELRKTL